jgi:hypothetical protein
MKNKRRYDLEMLLRKYVTPRGAYVTIAQDNRNHSFDCVIGCQHDYDKVFYMFPIPEADDPMFNEFTGTYRLLKEFLDKEYMKI